MNKKYGWLVGAIILVILLSVPMGVNALMFFNIWKVSGDEETWIGFLGTFVGAILGGGISGALTLIGVIITLKRQDRSNFKNRYPKIAVNQKKIKDIIQSFYLELHDNYTEKKETDLLESVKIIEEKADLMLEWSSEVSGECFLNVEAFLMIVGQFSTMYSEAIHFKFDNPKGAKFISLRKSTVHPYMESVKSVLDAHNKMQQRMAENYYGDRILE